MVQEQMPESQHFTQLQELEKQVLQAVAAQKLEVKYALRSAEHVKKKLRVYINNQHHNQQPAAPGVLAASSQEPPDTLGNANNIITQRLFAS